MHLIYKNAAQVIAWLGTPEPLQQVADRQKYRRRIFHPPEKAIRDSMPHNDYFSRLWILQELRFSTNTVFILAHKRFTVTDQLVCLVAARRKFSEDDPIYQRFGTALNLCGNTQDENLVEPYRLFRSIQTSGCTDPRDRVFALLNMFRSQHKQVLDPFFPDYELSLPRVNLITLAFLRQQYGDVTLDDPLYKDYWGLESYVRWLSIPDGQLPEFEAASVVAVRSVMCQKLQDPQWQQSTWILLPRPVDSPAVIAARMEDLRIVASRPLSMETEAEASGLRTKSWFVASP